MHVPREGFGKPDFFVLCQQLSTNMEYLTKGWTNSSVVLGLTFITQHQRRALGALTPPETFFGKPGKR